MRGFRIAVGVVFALALVAGAILLRRARMPEGFAEAFAHRGRLVVDGPSPIFRARLEGTQVTGVSNVPRVRATLAGRDPDGLRDALHAAGATGVVVTPRAVARGGLRAPLEDRLEALDSVSGFAGEVLAASAALYVPEEPLALSEEERAAMPRVARLVLAGVPPPLFGQFPPALRAPRTVEVVVIVRDASFAPTIWRSAKGGSLANGLLSAVASLRERWLDRQVALRGRPEDLVAAHHVEVALIRPDGLLLTHDEDFVEHAVHAEHGVGYDAPDGWQYVLPEMLRRDGVRGGRAAFAALFRANELPADSLSRSDLRFYRLRVEPIATSPAITTQADASSSSRRPPAIAP